MKPLEPEDRRHVEAAQGWLELGNQVEANERLEKIAAANRAHPDVFQVRWNVYARVAKWDACLDIATALTATVPDRRFGWVHRGFSLRKLNRHSEALAVYGEAVERFGMNPTFALGLACCHARLGDLTAARRHLGLAMSLAEDEMTQQRLNAKARQEPELEPLWHSPGAAGS